MTYISERYAKTQVTNLSAKGLHHATRSCVADRSQRNSTRANKHGTEDEKTGSLLARERNNNVQSKVW